MKRFALIFLGTVMSFFGEAQFSLLKDMDAGTGGNNGHRFWKLKDNLWMTSAFGTGVGQELWKTDGTADGTVIIKDLYPGVSGGAPFQSDKERSILNGEYYFAGIESSSVPGLYKTDGTSTGTIQIANVAAPQVITAIDNTLYFVGATLSYTTGAELWKSDGTAAGTYMIKDIRPGSQSSLQPSGSDETVFFVKANGYVFFNANDGIDGNELWRTDGTADGTQMVKDILPGSGSGLPQLGIDFPMVEWNNILYFAAEDVADQKELWRSDGTAAGTYKVVDLGGASGSYIGSILVWNNALYFLYNTASGTQLYRSDGTSAGTTLVTSQVFTQTSYYLANGRSLFYFNANTGATGLELWRSDGTAAGTSMVKDLWPGSSSGMPEFYSFRQIVSDDKIYFTGNDGTTGNEVYVSDGTDDGTHLFYDGIPGNTASNPYAYSNVANKLVIKITTPSYGDEYWISDGDLFAEPSNTITINPQTWIPLCQNSGFAIAYTATGQYNADNSFTAQLSDADGSFNNPTNIGTTASTSSGTIQCELTSPPPGTHYRIRVIASDLVTIGSDNGTDIEIRQNYTYYRDADEDGFGDADQSIETCYAITGYVTENTDCDDSRLLYTDDDGDGYGTGAPVACGVADNTDCNDADINVHSPQSYFADEDGDGFGDAGNSTSLCSSTPPPGYVSDNSDCNDHDNTVYIGAPELCDGKDNNCDGQIDEGCEPLTVRLNINGSSNAGTSCAGEPVSLDGSGTTGGVAPYTYGWDLNGDGDFTDAGSAITSVSYDGVPGTSYTVCLKVTDATGKSGISCGTVTIIAKTTYYRDADSDGYGDANNSVESCSQPPGYVTENTDCDDNDATVYPHAPELCDGKDNDCDGTVDDGLTRITYYRDADHDGLGDANNSIENCSQLDGYVTNSDDCDDTNPVSLTASVSAENIICTGGTTTVTVTASGGTEPYSGTGTFTLSAGTYNYTISDAHGCTASAGITISDGTGRPPSKPSKIKGDQFNLCGGGDHTYSINAVATATAYTWSVPGGFTLVQNNGNSAVVNVPATFNTADIGVQAVNSCGSSPSSGLKLFAVAPSPSSKISGPSLLTPQQKGVIYSLPNVTGFVYTWAVPPGASIVTGQGTNRIKVDWGDNSGYVKATVANACGTSPTGKLYVTVGSALMAATTKTQLVQPGVQLYPNPTQSLAQLAFSADKPNSKYEIRLADANGKILMVKMGVATYGVNNEMIDLSAYANGVYMITLIRAESSKVIKLIKSK